MLDQSVRILQALCDVAADAGWLMTTLNTIALYQMVLQGLPLFSFHLVWNNHRGT